MVDTVASSQPDTLRWWTRRETTGTPTATIGSFVEGRRVMSPLSGADRVPRGEISKEPEVTLYCDTCSNTSFGAPEAAECHLCEDGQLTPDPPAPLGSSATDP